MANAQSKQASKQATNQPTKQEQLTVVIIIAVNTQNSHMVHPNNRQKLFVEQKAKQHAIF
jgi:hypothetical protein